MARADHGDARRFAALQQGRLEVLDKPLSANGAGKEEDGKK